MDSVIFRCNHQRGGMGHIPLLGLLVIQVIFSQGDLITQLAKCANHLPVGMREHVFVAFGGEQKQRYLIGQLLEGRFKLLQVRLARHFTLSGIHLGCILHR